jgi:hypothetical protein
MHIEAASYDAVMEKHFRFRKALGMTEADSKENFYGFAAGDVLLVHVRKNGFRDGVFFRLRDGRVFDVSAREHDPDPRWYDQTTH